MHLDQDDRMFTFLYLGLKMINQGIRLTCLGKTHSQEGYQGSYFKI